MNRDAWIIFAGLAAAIAVGLLGTVAWQKDQQLAALEKQMVTIRSTAASDAARTAEAWHEVEMARSRAERLAQDVAAATNSQARLEAEMRSVLQSRDVAISELRGELTLTILDRILFDSGDATLKPEGMQVLDEIAGVLARYTNRPVQVFGHTDNVPIRFKFPSNWELSASRAIAAVRYLTEKAGVDSARLSAVACGEFQPIAENSTAEGRAKNRRIALVVLPEQFVPSDVPIAASEAAETNAVASPTPPPVEKAASSGEETPPSPEAPEEVEQPEEAPSTNAVPPGGGEGA